MPTGKSFGKTDQQLPWEVPQILPEKSNNPYLPVENRNRAETAMDFAKTNQNEQNQFKDDDLDLEAVISNDLNIRKEISSLSNMFGQAESDSQQIDKPKDLQ